MKFTEEQLQKMTTLQFCSDELRAMTGEDRLMITLEMNRRERERKLRALRVEYPQASERELHLRLASGSIDRETMIAAFGWDPLTP